jgi:hypothetical protein
MLLTSISLRTQTTKFEAHVIIDPGMQSNITSMKFNGDVPVAWYKILPIPACQYYFLGAIFYLKKKTDNQARFLNPLRTEVYFCHQNQNAKYIGNFMALLKPQNISTHLKGIETSFQVVPLFFGSYIIFWNFLKIPSG